MRLGSQHTHERPLHHVLQRRTIELLLLRQIRTNHRQQQTPVVTERNATRRRILRLTVTHYHRIHFTNLRYHSRPIYRVMNPSHRIVRIRLAQLVDEPQHVIQRYPEIVHLTSTIQQLTHVVDVRTVTSIPIQLAICYRILVHRTLRHVHHTPQSSVVRVHHTRKLQRILRLLVPVTKVPARSHPLLRHLHHDVVTEVEIQTRQHDRLVEIARHRVVIRSERVVVGKQLVVR